MPESFPETTEERVSFHANLQKQIDQLTVKITETDRAAQKVQKKIKQVEKLKNKFNILS